MGKTKTKSRSNSKDVLRGTNTSLVKSTVTSKSQKSTESLLEEAATFLEHSQPEEALLLVQEALARLEADRQAYADIDVMLQNAAQEKATFPTALVLGADVSLALGHADVARKQFERAIQIDPNGALISAEPYLQLAQLCEEGGHKSIHYFDKAIEVMKNEIDVLEEQSSIEGTQEIIDQRRANISDALCAMAEVYMTDLSWEPDAEQRCEQLLTEAVATCPDSLSAGVLQTLASMRISQDRLDEAKRALAQSLSLWKDLPPDVDHPAKPDFATRVSLVRLLMEVEEEQEALIVLQGLIKEDDRSVECLYLTGWCHLLLAQKPDVSEPEQARLTHCEQAHAWLRNCLKLYRMVQYEDEPLRTHAEELLHTLTKRLNLPDGNADEDEDEDWESDDDKDDSDQGEAEIETHDAHHNGNHLPYQISNRDQDQDRDRDIEMT